MPGVAARAHSARPESDGVYFTQAGARKLAHYVEREVQRWLSARPAPVVLTIPEEPKVEAPAPAGRSGSHERPLAGPVVPLSGERGSEADDLLGGNDSQLAPDAMAAKVLVRGEPVRAPAGRADDFVWPRRGVAPFGSDPVVATTDLPMTPMTTATMGAATPSRKLATAEAPPAKPAVPRRVTPRPPAYAYVQSMYLPDYRRPPVQGLFNFQSLFGGRW